MSQGDFYKRQLLSSFDWLASYVDNLVRKQVKEVMAPEVEKTRLYYEEERSKLQKVASDLYHYITTSGQLKEGITVAHANKVLKLEEQIREIKMRLDNDNLAKR